jgi:hypothetical protein
MKYKIKFKAQDFGLTNMLNKSEDDITPDYDAIVKFFKESFMVPKKTDSSGSVITFGHPAYKENDYPRREVVVDLQKKTFGKWLHWLAGKSNKEEASYIELKAFRALGLSDAHNDNPEEAYHSLFSTEKFMKSKEFFVYKENSKGTVFVKEDDCGPIAIFVSDNMELESYNGEMNPDSGEFDVQDHVKIEPDILRFFDGLDYNISWMHKNETGQQITDWYGAK